MNLKEQVKMVRKALLLTQKQLAHAVGVSEVTIARWESKDGIKPQMVAYGKFISFCKKNGIEIKEVA